MPTGLESLKHPTLTRDRKKGEWVNNCLLGWLELVCFIVMVFDYWSTRKICVSPYHCSQLDLTVGNKEGLSTNLIGLQIPEFNSASMAISLHWTPLLQDDRFQSSKIATRDRFYQCNCCPGKETDSWCSSQSSPPNQDSFEEYSIGHFIN